jgi:hypothetical protein
MLNDLLSKLVVKNVKTGQQSYVLTAFIVGIAIVNIKLLLSGIEVNGIKMSEFTGVDYSAAIAALGGIYTLNKKVGIDAKKTKKDEE